MASGDASFQSYLNGGFRVVEIGGATSWSYLNGGFYLQAIGGASGHSYLNTGAVLYDDRQSTGWSYLNTGYVQPETVKVTESLRGWGVQAQAARQTDIVVKGADAVAYNYQGDVTV